MKEHKRQCLGERDRIIVHQTRTQSPVFHIVYCCQTYQQKMNHRKHKL